MEIKKGQLVVFTTGEYSDYQHVFYARALRDFDTRQTVEGLKRIGAYETMQEVTVWENTGKSGYPKMKPVKRLQASTFGVEARWFRFLQDTGAIEEVDDIAEVHMGAYGQFTPN